MVEKKSSVRNHPHPQSIYSATILFHLSFSFLLSVSTTIIHSPLQLITMHDFLLTLPSVHSVTRAWYICKCECVSVYVCKLSFSFRLNM